MSFRNAFRRLGQGLAGKIKNNGLQTALKPGNIIADQGFRITPTGRIPITFVTPEKLEIKAFGEEGMNLLEVAHENDVDLEGACECSCACSTCHLILEEGLYDNLEEPSDEEMDMLDLAFGLTETSRLGCQIKLTKDMANSKFYLPAATRNFYVDGAKPTHH
ncbi:Adrenodoxin-like protein 1, mitochondrial [Zancudomyces culisetae]|uniref:2Fe-2S ferredoxin n=1 Tax=Zancudomyces culisetae TaxID=1213189 RepID=A0A1R1PLY0_ZANCU|nr:Adrenodoxin-like protein 1, mitochondrial [Zancudomyces culisetae]|eukprot:OMH81939.1 Adrenodoxin-like protein 1, mitochondrial [Zancudomyces culisetae]